MPELPEVETICRQLKKEVADCVIEDAVVKDERIIKDISAKEFKKLVKRRRIKNVFRRGKVLVFALEKKLFIVIHLRISGWILLSGKEEKSSRVLFKLSGGLILNYCDSRALGEIKLINDWQALPLIQHMGPEPLLLKKDEFVKIFFNKKSYSSWFS